jgi:hypothetical protein
MMLVGVLRSQVTLFLVLAVGMLSGLTFGRGRYESGKVSGENGGHVVVR